MVALLRLLWGVISRVLPGLATSVASATGLVVASAAARAVAIGGSLLAFALWMPMPSWLQSVPSLVANIPAGVLFVMGYARLREGIAIVLSAYVVRFAARFALRVFG